MAEDEAYLRLSNTMLDAIGRAVSETEWAPPEGAVLTDAVVIMGWATLDGEYGESSLRCGSPWATRGLVAHEAHRIRRVDAEDFDDDDD